MLELAQSLQIGNSLLETSQNFQQMKIMIWHVPGLKELRILPMTCPQ
jgi:hypothetical protein